ncbi:MAG TPA: hypothetical protein VF384_08130 [Planctomycetota bacterium]
MTVILIAAIAMWFFGDRLFAEARESNAELPSLSALTLIQYLFVVATGVLIVLEALRYSNRVVGPVMRITRVLRQIREGNLGETVTLRKGDVLTDVADQLNALIEHMRKGAPAGSGSPPPGSGVNPDTKYELEVAEYAE